MGTTYRNIVSDIRGMNKLLSSDNLINDRVVLNEIRSVANMIVGQALNKRKYWTSPNLFTKLSCIEFEQTSLSECCEYTNPCTISKSLQIIPKIGEGMYGLAISGLFAIDTKQKFKPTDPNRFANLLKIGLPKMGIYFWIMDGHLYTTNPDLKSATLYAYFTEPVPNELLYPTGCGCKQDPSLELQCKNPLDLEIKFPEERLQDLKQQVYKNLLSVYFNVPSEGNKTSDNKDDTTK